MSSHDTPANGVFEVTLWSRVLRAGEADGPASRQALEELCRSYWGPIYAFLRRTGKGHEPAQDLAQGFFHYLLQRGLVSQAVPGRGRFRSFLIGILKNYVRDEQKREQALRRGGGAEVVSLDGEIVEGRSAPDPATHGSPEKLLDRQWALQVLDQASKRLRAEQVQAGNAERFDVLRPHLTDDSADSFAALGERLDLSPGTVRTQVCRLRKQFREHLRSIVAETVATPEDVELELAHLLAALLEH